MRKSTLLMIIMCAITTSVLAQYTAIRNVENYAANRIGAFYSRGFMVPHSKVMLNMPQGPIQQLELFYERQLKGKKTWQHSHALPSWRAIAMYTHLGNPSLGSAYTLAGAFNFPIFRSKHFQFSHLATFGIGFFPKHFQVHKHEENPAIGSLINFHVRFAFEAEFRLQKHLFAYAGLSFGHWSNGALKMPNLGINVPAFYFGLKGGWGLFNTHRYKTFRVKYPFTLNIMANTGIKEIDPPKGKIYPVAHLGIEVAKQLTFKSTITFGNDLFYDASIMDKSRYLAKPINGNKMYIRSGLHLGYEFCINHLSIYAHFGVYYLRFDNLTGPLYQRIGLKYRVHPNIFLNTSLKSHMFTADCVEFGLGYRLNLQRKRNDKTF